MSESESGGGGRQMCGKRGEHHAGTAEEATAAAVAAAGEQNLVHLRTGAKTRGRGSGDIQARLERSGRASRYLVGGCGEVWERETT